MNIKFNSPETEIVFEWMQSHPDILRTAIGLIKRKRSRDRLHNSLWAFTYSCLMDVDRESEALTRVVQVAMEHVDWDQLVGLLYDPADDPERPDAAD